MLHSGMFANLLEAADTVADGWLNISPVNLEITQIIIIFATGYYQKVSYQKVISCKSRIINQLSV